MRSVMCRITQREAAEIDEILMGPLGFSVDQLMEFAGLSVATSVAEVYLGAVKVLHGLYGLRSISLQWLRFPEQYRSRLTAING
ncbi:hypothetical protein Bca4012_066859 [Brassica carinata]